MPATIAASRAFGSGTTIARLPRRRASSATGNTPLTARTAPLSASSPTKQKSVEGILLDFLRGRDHAERDREIEARAFLLNVGWGEIDRGPPARPIITAVADRGRDPILAFFDRGVGQADDHDPWVAAGGVNLDLDFVGVDAVDGGGVNSGEHAPEIVRRKARSPNCRAKNLPLRARAVFVPSMR